MEVKQPGLESGPKGDAGAAGWGFNQLHHSASPSLLFAEGLFSFHIWDNLVVGHEAVKSFFVGDFGETNPVPEVQDESDDLFHAGCSFSGLCPLGLPAGGMQCGHVGRSPHTANIWEARGDSPASNPGADHHSLSSFVSFAGNSSILLTLSKSQPPVSLGFLHDFSHFHVIDFRCHQLSPERCFTCAWNIFIHCTFIFIMDFCYSWRT